MPILFLLAAQAAAAGIAPRTTLPARPLAPLASYVGGYPAAALRNEEQGVVGFRLEIDPAGAVAGCTVIVSSGSAALDLATCRDLRLRARFAPARNAAGMAVADSYSGRLRWALPAEPAVPAPPPVRAQPLANFASYVQGGDMPAAVAARGRVDAMVHFELAIDPRGRVTACRITQSGGIAALDAATCRIMRARARFRPARDAAGNAVADTAASSIRWFLP